MLIVIFGESCVGKTTLAEKLRQRLSCPVYTGKDYKRLAKNENMAKAAFQALLEKSVTDENLIWVVSEKDDLALVPEGAVRVLMTAELACIQSRFAARMRGNLPKPVADMLARKHGCFDQEPYDYHVADGRPDAECLCSTILEGRG